jgi:hypothetical protein
VSKKRLTRRQGCIGGAAGDFLGKDKEYFLFMQDNTRPCRLREPGHAGVAELEQLKK